MFGFKVQGQTKPKTAPMMHAEIFIVLSAAGVAIQFNKVGVTVLAFINVE